MSNNTEQKIEQEKECNSKLYIMAIVIIFVGILLAVYYMLFINGNDINSGVKSSFGTLYSSGFKSGSLRSFKN